MKIKNIVKNLKRKWPLVWRSTFYNLVNAKKGVQEAADRKLSSALQSHREDRAKAVREAGRTCGEIVEKLSDFDWHKREREHFCLTIMFDSRMYGYVQGSPECLDMMVRHLCDQLKYEIKSHRFVMPPERAREDRMRRPQYAVNKLDPFR
jgi:hypothetical protein